MNKAILITIFFKFVSLNVCAGGGVPNYSCRTLDQEILHKQEIRSLQTGIKGIIATVTKITQECSLIRTSNPRPFISQYKELSFKFNPNDTDLELPNQNSGYVQFTFNERTKGTVTNRFPRHIMAFTSTAISLETDLIEISESVFNTAWYGDFEIRI